MRATHARGFFDFLVAHAFLIFHQDGIALALRKLLDELAGQTVAFFLPVVGRWLGQHEAFRVDGHGGPPLSELVDAAPFDDGQAEFLQLLALVNRAALLPERDDGFLDGIRRTVGIAHNSFGGALQEGLQLQNVLFEVLNRHACLSFNILSQQRLKSYSFREKKIKSPVH